MCASQPNHGAAAAMRLYAAGAQGGEEQLKDVWEESDGLNRKDFDPRTFFYLHGLECTSVLLSVDCIEFFSVWLMIMLRVMC